MTTEERPSPWWPESSTGKAIFMVVIIGSGMTVLIDPVFFVINVAFWYILAVVIRLVFLRISKR